MKYDQLITGLGISKSAAKVYLAALALGPATAIQLAKQTALTRQMIYNLVLELEGQGLMHKVNLMGRPYFAALSPEVLQERAEDLSRKISAAIPILKAQQAGQDLLPRVELFETMLTATAWFEQFMEEAKPGEELLVWSTNASWLAWDEGLLERYIAFKNAKGIKERIIAPDSKLSRESVEVLAQPHAEYRFTRDYWESGAEKWIWRDSVIYLTAQDQAANLMVVTSTPLTAIERFSFERIWLWLRPEGKLVDSSPNLYDTKHKEA